MSLEVSLGEYRQSVHGPLLVCQDCHRGYEQVPHPAVNVASYREYTIGAYEVCRRCHFSNYARTLDSIHYEQLAKGMRNAPVCTDCHDSHTVSSPNHPRSRIAQTCSQCHEEVYGAYMKSVHGRDLVEQDNQDVPSCTYCHGVHNVSNPGGSNFRLEIPELCGSCHADEERMKKYGLSTNVLKTYLQDFHGKTVELVLNQNPELDSLEAVCTDCHGTHDIVSVQDPSSPVLKANLVETCRQCHPEATENFPSAWLSHYEPSLKHTPLVFLTKTFYLTLIPLMILGLLIHVVLNLWRSATNR